MSVSYSQQVELAQLNEIIQSLQLQITELSQRLANVEGSISPSINGFQRNAEGNAAFLGTKYQKPEIALEITDTSRNGRFLGNDYNVSDSKVKMKSDGTKRTFLGRKFGGKTLDH